ncbi:MAG: DUF86 domain-containing protein [Chloroflexi bacterium]|nr:DUF86 domain-containing protein [Chloroflexota bacterium]
MSPIGVSLRSVADRLALIDYFLAEIRALPLNDTEEFFRDTRNVWTCESCLRRSLEALLDIGRHILAKGYGIAVTEYAKVGERLGKDAGFRRDEAELLQKLAGYRNRMVHFYHEITPEELHRICRDELHDVETITNGLRRWIRENPDKIDETL